MSKNTASEMNRGENDGSHNPNRTDDGENGPGPMPDGDGPGGWKDASAPSLHPTVSLTEDGEDCGSGGGRRRSAPSFDPKMSVLTDSSYDPMTASRLTDGSFDPKASGLTTDTGGGQAEGGEEEGTEGRHPVGGFAGSQEGQPKENPESDGGSRGLKSSLLTLTSQEAGELFGIDDSLHAGEAVSVHAAPTPAEEEAPRRHSAGEAPRRIGGGASSFGLTSSPLRFERNSDITTW